MTSSKDSHEGEVAAALNLSIFIAAGKFQVVGTGFVESFLARPLKCLCPCLVTEPIADEVSITSVD